MSKSAKKIVKVRKTRSSSDEERVKKPIKAVSLRSCSSSDETPAKIISKKKPVKAASQKSCSSSDETPAKIISKKKPIKALSQSSSSDETSAPTKKNLSTKPVKSSSIDKDLVRIIEKTDEKGNIKKHYMCRRCQKIMTTKKGCHHHIRDRTYPCIPNNKKFVLPKPIVESKPIITPKYKYNDQGKIVCKICPKKKGVYCSYASVSSYNKHLGTEIHKGSVILHKSHANINGNKNRIDQSVNKTVNIDQSVHIVDNSVNHIMLVLNDTPVERVDYLSYDIDDITLFDQYYIFQRSINKKYTPYTNLMDIFNFSKDKYNNMKPVTDNSYLVYSFEPKPENSSSSSDDEDQDSEESDSDSECDNLNNKESDDEMIGVWRPGTSKTIKKLAVKQCAVLSAIYNKFRFFFSRKANIFGPKYIYDGFKVSENYTVNNDHIRQYILSTKKRGKSKYGGKLYPKKRSHSVWNSLSKTFTFQEVEECITQMTDMGIDFNDNVSNIKHCIDQYIDDYGDIEQTKSLIKLKGKLDFLEYRKKCYGRNNYDADTSGDEEGRFNGTVEPVINRRPKFDQIVDKRPKIDLGDHATNVPLNTYYGVDKISHKSK